MELNQNSLSGNDGTTILSHQSLVPSQIEPASPKSQTYLLGLTLGSLVLIVISLLASPVEHSQPTQEEVYQNGEQLIWMAY